MAQAATFRLDGITRRYGALTALDGVTLESKGNEYVALLGPSGSGKTTLLRAIAGFEPLDGGRVLLEGQDVTGLPPHRRGIGFVFQNFALFPHLSVLRNVAYGLENGPEPVARAVVARRCADAIALVGLKGLEERGVEQISGGQKQRVALARTLVMQPRLVLLDEPLGALDANLRHRMRNELRAIRERLGVTFLHVTGSETEALAMGDQVVVLDQGRIAQAGSAGEVYDRPASPNVAHFLNRFNLFEGRLRDGAFEGQFGRVQAPQARAAARDVYAVRYDRMRAVAAGGPEGGPALPATFVASEYLGSSMMYFFETGDRRVVEAEHHLSLGAPPAFEPRQPCVLTWDPDQAIVFGREGLA